MLLKRNYRKPAYVISWKMIMIMNSNSDREVAEEWEAFYRQYAPHALIRMLNQKEHVINNV